MKSSTGGINRRDHVPNDTVYFPAGYARQMVNYLEPHLYNIPLDGKILDACSGSGVLGKAFFDLLTKWDQEYNEEFGYESTPPTLTLAEKSYGLDVFHLSPEIEDHKFDLIVSNPPRSLSVALPIYWHLVSLLADDGVLFFIINNVFCYQGSKRAETLKYQKYYFLPRWIFKPSGRKLLDCGVMVYHADGKVPDDAVALRPYIEIEKGVV